MKRLFFFALLPCLLGCSVLCAQDHRQPVDPSNGALLYIAQYESVKGSQFFFTDWLPGQVIATGGRQYAAERLKFDVMNNKFVFSRHDTVLEIVPAPAEVRLFPPGGDTLLFRNGWPATGKIRPLVYLQALATGPVELLKHTSKNIEEYSEYGDATKYKRFADSYRYYVNTGSELREVKVNRKGLEELLQAKWTQVEDFLTRQKLNGRDEKSWIAAIRYYNSLPA